MLLCTLVHLVASRHAPTGSHIRAGRASGDGRMMRGCASHRVTVRLVACRVRTARTCMWMPQASGPVLCARRLLDN
eukprot:3730330-Prymnesium_polylepis.1